VIGPPTVGPGHFDVIAPDGASLGQVRLHLEVTIHVLAVGEPWVHAAPLELLRMIRMSVAAAGRDVSWREGHDTSGSDGAAMTGYRTLALSTSIAETVRATLREQVRLGGIDAEREAVRLLARADVDYIHVHDLAAGCYDFRIGRAEAENGGTHAA
jgi:hypothetical protein